MAHERRAGELEEGSAEHETPPSRSRRAFVFMGALAAGALVPRAVRAQRPIAPGRRRIAEPEPDPDRSWGRPLVPNEAVAAPSDWQNPRLRLIRRVTNGATLADTTLASLLGYQGYLNYQLHHTTIDDTSVETNVAARWPLLAQTPAQLVTANSFTAQTQLQEATVYRAAFSQRQLYQRM